MREQVGHLPATEIEIGAKVVILLRIVVAPFHRPQEARPIEIRRLRRERGRRLPKVIRVSVPPGSRQSDFAQLAGADVLIARANVMRTRALLHSHLNHAVVHAGRLDDRGALFDFEC